jgi:predicted acylesterase/phospholipase RssA
MKPTAYVAFQGGGALGMAHLGAWQYLAERFDVGGVAGTSAGAIVAALCAAGSDPAHVIDIFANLEWRQYVARQNLFSLLWRLDAWSSGRRFEQWLRDRLQARFPDLAPQEITFGELFQRTGIYLAIVACDLNRPRPEPVVFTKDSEPGTLVSFAVRASIAIPGYFATVPRRGSGQVFVDGGVLLNLPARPLRPSAQAHKAPLIGVRFTQPHAYLEDPKIWETIGRTKDILLAAGSLPDEELLNDPDYIDVQIDVQGFRSLDFQLKDDQKRELVRRGAQAAELALLRYRARSGTSLPAAEAAPPMAQTQAPEAAGPVANSRPSADSQRLEQADRDALIRLLLDCPSMSDDEGRNAVIQRLPAPLRLRIRHNPATYLHVSNIVNKAAEYENGVEQLIAAVHFFDDDALAVQRIDVWWRGR